MLWLSYLINSMLCEQARLTVLQNQVLFIHSKIQHWTGTPPGTHIPLVLTSVLQTQAEFNAKRSVYCRMLICLQFNYLNSSYFLILFSIFQSPFLWYLVRICLSTISLETSSVNSFSRITMDLEWRKVPFNPCNVFNIKKTMMVLPSL